MCALIFPYVYAEHNFLYTEFDLLSEFNLSKIFFPWIIIISKSKYFAIAESSQKYSVHELTGDGNQIVKQLL